MLHAPFLWSIIIHTQHHANCTVYMAHREGYHHHQATITIQYLVQNTQISGRVGREKNGIPYSQNEFLIISLFPPNTRENIHPTPEDICRELIHIFDDDSQNYSGPHSDSQVKDQWWCVMMGLGHFTLWCLSLFQLPKLSPLLHHCSRDSHTQGWLNDLQASIKWFLSKRKPVSFNKVEPFLKLKAKTFFPQYNGF